MTGTPFSGSQRTQVPAWRSMRDARPEDWVVCLSQFLVQVSMTESLNSEILSASLCVKALFRKLISPPARGFWIDGDTLGRGESAGLIRSLVQLCHAGAACGDWTFLTN